MRVDHTVDDQAGGGDALETALLMNYRSDRIGADDGF
jgi:hypothetical protein